MGMKKKAGQKEEKESRDKSDSPVKEFRGKSEQKIIGQKDKDQQNDPVRINPAQPAQFFMEEMARDSAQGLGCSELFLQ